jgi:hypothetical protein
MRLIRQRLIRNGTNVAIAPGQFEARGDAVNRVSHWIAAAAATVIASAASAGPAGHESGPNLVSNGSFENTSTVAGSGWTVSGPTLGEGIDYYIDTVQGDAHTGSKSFAGGAVGAEAFLTQTIATTPGANYNIHFWMSNFGGFADGTALDVFWNGVSVLSLTDILGFSYHEFVIDPIATGPLTTLSFGFRNDSGFLNIDDVSVRAVPEPSLAWLLAAGAVVAVVRRRRSKG